MEGREMGNHCIAGQHIHYYASRRSRTRDTVKLTVCVCVCVFVCLCEL